MTQTEANPGTELGNLFVVPSACVFDASCTSGRVAIQSKNPAHNLAFEELQHADARHLAIGYATRQGVAGAAINGSGIGPYPVNDDGVPLEDVKGENGEPLEPTHMKKQVAGYRIEIPVCRKLV